MRLDDMPESSNVEDRRGDDGGGFGGGGGMGGLPIGGGGLGIGGMVVLGLVGWALGIDPWMLINGANVVMGDRGGYEQRAPQPSEARRTGPVTDEAGKFVARVLGSTEVEWKDIFAKDGQTYRAPKLVMFAGRTNSACGAAQSAMGPFYCPNDREVYLDTSFFRELETRFRGCSGKACDFSKAYVIAHEVGHHVQNLLGILPKVQQAQRASGDRVESNRLQVMVELQADCFAGVWANHAEAKYKFLDPGDIEAALQTASAIGDDTLQRKAQGQVVPDSFTHGSAAQRQRWFSTGFKEGNIKACNTFAAARL
ncbi:MAG: neutral zinc metallopeptidase [Alphaproteobacteria bacterium]|nr:neutral zinc metallopeptidase [Alphaproteobacteria bacterium]